MSIQQPTSDEHAKRWRQWQRGNANSSGKTASRARLVFVLVLTAASAWLSLQIFYFIRST